MCSYFAPLKQSCGERGTASLLPDAAAFIQSESYADKLKVQVHMVMLTCHAISDTNDTGVSVSGISRRITGFSDL